MNLSPEVSSPISALKVGGSVHQWEDSLALKPFLAKVTTRPDWEAEWLDVLSQLEYVGCRKILKAVPYEKVSLEVLQHISEEASHAFLLKSVAASLGSKNVTGLRLAERPWTSNPFSDLGWQYFQALDACVSKIEAFNEYYPAVSWAVEQRALAIYPQYLELTTEPNVKRVLSRILAQEKRHGQQFGSALKDSSVLPKIRELEAPLWADFCAALWMRLETSGGLCPPSSLDS